MKPRHHVFSLLLQILSLLCLLNAFAHPAKADPVSAITGGIGMVGNIIGGITGAGAAKKAAAIQQQNAQHVADMATGAAKDAQSGIKDAVGTGNDYLSNAGLQSMGLYGAQTNNLNPYLAAGAQGAGTLAQMMAPGGDLTKQFSFDPNAVADTPEYKFALQQGTGAVQQSAAARGLLNSGATLKGIMGYGQGLASQMSQQAYQNALNTFQTNRNNTLQGLGMLTGIGQNATGQFNQATQNYGGINSTLAQMMSGNVMSGAQYSGNAGLQGAQLAGSALTGGANAQAAGVMGSQNAFQGALSGIGNTAIGLGQNYNFNKTLSQMGTYGAPSMGPFVGPPNVFGNGGSAWA